MTQKIDLEESTKIRSSSVTEYDQFLTCYGCSHSIGGAAFPSGPSGERPCFFCVRNENREDWQEEQIKTHGSMLTTWYDGSPIAFYPMDAYMTLDMNEQVERWSRKAKGEKDWNDPKGGIRFG